jgi:hypothetical protein
MSVLRLLAKTAFSGALLFFSFLSFRRFTFAVLSANLSVLLFETNFGIFLVCSLHITSSAPQIAGL